MAHMPSHPPIWDDLRVLLAVHRGKSFLAAGKALGIATSTVASPKGYRFVTLSELIAKKGSIEPGAGYRNGYVAEP